MGMKYLEDTMEEPHLWPNEPTHRAEVEQIVELIATDMQPLGNVAQVHNLEDLGFARSLLHRCFMALEDLLSITSGTPGMRHNPVDGPDIGRSMQAYSFRNHITMADVYLVPLVRWAIQQGFDMETYPYCFQVYRGCCAHPVIRKA